MFDVVRLMPVVAGLGRAPVPQGAGVLSSRVRMAGVAGAGMAAVVVVAIVGTVAVVGVSTAVVAAVVGVVAVAGVSAVVVTASVFTAIVGIAAAVVTAVVVTVPLWASPPLSPPLLWVLPPPSLLRQGRCWHR